MFVICENGWVGGGDNSNVKIPQTPHPGENQDVILLTRTSLQRAERENEDMSGGEVALDSGSYL